MRRQLRPAWVALVRHLGRAEVLRDLALLTAIGALASFAVLFTSRVLFDNVTHELSLDYAARLEGSAERSATPPSDLRLSMDDSAVVAPASSLGALHGDNGVETTVLAFEPGAPVGRWLAGAVRKGAVCEDGVLLDEATAAHLGARVGSDVTLWWPELDGQASGAVRLCGVLEVWHPENSLGMRGYLVASTAYLTRATPAFASSPNEQVADYWFSRVPPGAQTKGAAIRELVSDQVGWTKAVGIIALIGAVLWIFGVIRVWRWLLLGLDVPWRVLHNLGARRAVLTGFVAAITLVMALIAGVLSGVLARTTILGWTNLFITSRQILAVAATLLLIACGTVVVLSRRVPEDPANVSTTVLTGDLT